MTTKILTLTLLATALAFSSALPRETIKTTKQQSNSITTSIARTLAKRGIEDEKAIEIAQNFITQDEELLSIMITSYLDNANVKKDLLLNELSKLALLKKKLTFLLVHF